MQTTTSNSTHQLPRRGFVDIGQTSSMTGDGYERWQLASPPSDAQPIMGSIRLAPGADAEQMKQRIVAELPKDIAVLTPQEVRARENAFTLRSAPSVCCLA